LGILDFFLNEIDKVKRERERERERETNGFTCSVPELELNHLSS
jgi:hypothetical protein